MKNSLELTKKEKLRVLNEALELYKESNKIAGLCYFISNCIKGYTLDVNVKYGIERYIPEFIRPKHTYKNNSPYWWPYTKGEKSRINYLIKLIKKIEEQN